MYRFFAIRAVVIMMSEALNESRRDYYIFLIVVIVSVARDQFIRGTFGAPVDMDVLMLIHSFRYIAGSTFVAYRSAFFLRGVIIISVFPVEESFLLKEHLLILFYD